MWLTGQLAQYFLRCRESILGQHLIRRFFGSNIFYSCRKYTKKDWVRLKVQHYPPFSLYFRDLQCDSTERKHCSSAPVNGGNALSHWEIYYYQQVVVSVLLYLYILPLSVEVPMLHWRNIVCWSYCWGQLRSSGSQHDRCRSPGAGMCCSSHACPRAACWEETHSQQLERNDVWKLDSVIFRLLRLFIKAGNIRSIQFQPILFGSKLHRK